MRRLCCAAFRRRLGEGGGGRHGAGKDARLRLDADSDSPAPGWDTGLDDCDWPRAGPRRRLAAPERRCSSPEGWAAWPRVRGSGCAAAAPRRRTLGQNKRGLLFPAGRARDSDHRDGHGRGPGAARRRLSHSWSRSATVSMSHAAAGRAGPPQGPPSELGSAAAGRPPANLKVPARTRRPMLGSTVTGTGSGSPRRAGGSDSTATPSAGETPARAANRRSGRPGNPGRGRGPRETVAAGPATFPRSCQWSLTPSARLQPQMRL